MKANGRPPLRGTGESKAMGDAMTRDPYGESTARIVADSVLELRTRGHVTRANSLAMFDHGAALLRERPDVHALVFEMSEHEGHDPGNVAHGVRWLRDQGAQLTRAAIVTRSHAFATLIHIGRVMVPRLEAAVFASREEAIAWCAAASAPEAPTRHRTGRHRRSDAA